MSILLQIMVIHFKFQIIFQISNYMKQYLIQSFFCFDIGIKYRIFYRFPSPPLIRGCFLMFTLNVLGETEEMKDLLGRTTRDLEALKAER